MIRMKEIGKDCTRFTLSTEHLENLPGRNVVRAPDISRRGNRNATLLSSVESAVAAPCWPAVAHRLFKRVIANTISQSAIQGADPGFHAIQRDTIQRFDY